MHEGAAAGVRAGLAALAAAGALALPAAVRAADAEAPDVCALVPGADVAARVGATLSTARSVKAEPTRSRCVYRVRKDGAERAFVVWWMPAEEFDGLRAATDDAKPVAGVGDAAYAKYDRDARRHGIVAVRRGRALVEVTGEDPVEVRAIALLALGRF